MNADRLGDVVQEQRKSGRPGPEDAQKIPRRIHDAAISLFEEVGYDHTTMDQIARRAHVSKRTLYARYSTKENLFLSIVEGIDAAKLAQLQAVEIDASGLQKRLESLARKLTVLLVEARFIAFERIAVAQMHTFPELAQTRSERLATCLGTIVSAILKEASPFTAMSPRELELCCELFISMTILSTVRRAMSSPAPVDVDARFVKRSVAVFLAGHAPEEGRPLEAAPESGPAAGGDGKNAGPEREGAPAAARQRRKGLATRDRILQAAVSRFARQSYDDVGLRDIAADAGVDVAYVHRSFGSKADLFVKALDSVSDPDKTNALIASTHLPQAMREFFAQSGEIDYRLSIRPLDLIVRSLGSLHANTILSQKILAELIVPLSSRLKEPNMARATMIVAILLGAGMARDVMRFPAFMTDLKNVEPLLEAAVDAVVSV